MLNFGQSERFFSGLRNYLKKPLEPDRTLLEHWFLTECKRSCTRFLQMGPAAGFVRP